MAHVIGESPDRSFRYELEDGTALRAFVHDILMYRYHWHNNVYELDILLTGAMEFVRSGEKYLMGPGDLIILDPGEGHASRALEPNTVALVFQFSKGAFQGLLGQNVTPKFHFVSNEQTRGDFRYRQLRLFSTLILRAVNGQGEHQAETIRSAFELMRIALLTYMDPQLSDAGQASGNSADQASMRGIMEYIGENYARKISLEELSTEFGYNRTYISTFFKKNLGIGFYDYLINVRFSHAVWDLISTDNSLTKVAMYNGFPDLKTFNRYFQEFFHLTPMEYRATILPELSRQIIDRPYGFRNYRTLDDPEVKKQLDAFIALG